jgi:TetR/AcrR family transcriptional repressor of nem operon
MVRENFLNAAIRLVRSQGFAATSVDELCRDAGVTKGAFFHYFPSKEALGEAAADHWTATTGAFFAEAAYHQLADPADRVLAYVDLRRELISGTPAEYSCFAGTLVQETFVSSPVLRDACRASILGHAATLESDIADALFAHPVDGVDAAGLARHIQAVLQGAFVVSKAADDPQLAVDSLDHLRRYLEYLFATDPTTPEETR